MRFMKKENMENDKWRAKCVYVPPCVEVYAAEPGRLLEQSFNGGHTGADETYDTSDHAGGNDGGIEYGAKAVILGQEFSFSDIWAE